MSKFTIGVSAGVAKVYPYGQRSDVAKVLQAGDELLCEVPVGPHPEPRSAPAPGGTLRAKAGEDADAPAAGVADGEPRGQRAGTLTVAVTEGAVTLRTYAGNAFSEQKLEVGASASVEVTETNHITIAVYDAAPVVDPR